MFQRQRQGIQKYNSNDYPVKCLSFYCFPKLSSRAMVPSFEYLPRSRQRAVVNAFPAMNFDLTICMLTNSKSSAHSRLPIAMIACEMWDIPSERVTTREEEFPRLRSRAKSCYSRHSDYVCDNLRICSWSRANSETENSYFSLWHHPWWASCTVISWRSFLSIISISSILECRAIDKNNKIGKKALAPGNFGKA